MSTTFRPPLLVLVGPTGSGKSDLAHEIAVRRGGEIVSADAFAVYRGFDVGTDKPSPQRRAEVRYHLVDVAEPEESFSAGRFAAEARRAVEDIVGRGRLPIVCGGSGFYLAALLDGLPPGEVRNERLRADLLSWGRLRGPEAAHRFLARNDPAAAARIPVENLKFTLRALEIVLLTGRPASARLAGPDAWSRQFDVVKLGLDPGRAQLHVRIEARAARMLESGWGDEVRRLLDRGLPVESNSFQAIGYREVAGWILGRIPMHEAQARIVTATRGLAKRQMTWLARQSDVRWVTAEEALATALALPGGAEGRGT